MKKSILTLVFILAMFLVSIPAYGVPEADIFSQEIDEILAGEKDTLDVIVYLKEKIDPFQAAEDNASGDNQKEKKNSSRISLVNALKDNQNKSQKELLDFLDLEKSKGKVIDYDSFYIVNAIRIQADKTIIQQLKRFANIQLVELNHQLEMETNGQPISLEGETVGIPWSLVNTRVVDVWNQLGNQGAGVVIGVIDSGVDVNHPALLAKWRGYDPATNTMNSYGNWVDFVNKANPEPLPVDSWKHGTAVTSIAVGGLSDGSDVMGVAPQAKWIAARAFSEHTALESDIILAAQWMLAPEGDPTLAPDVINNSWGSTADTDPWFQDLLATWQAAGIFPVFAAGNAQATATAGSIENPASLLSAFSVGAVDQSNIIGYFSKRGPSLFDASQTIIKPEVVAPGVAVRTAVPYYEYATWTGTSVAAPHISGLAALMLSANPDLEIDEIGRIIKTTAQPLSDANFPQSPNMAYGHGLMDAYQAVTEAQNYLKMERLAGTNRYETALKISQAYFPEGCQTVYIANGYRYADSLAMSSLTKYAPGPLLLTDGQSLSEQTISELKRLAPEKIVLIGGTAVVSVEVANQIEQSLTIKPLRIGGQNRYDTANLLAADIVQQSGIKRAFLVHAINEADAVSIAATAARDGVPIFLTLTNEIDAITIAGMINLGITHVTIVGGEMAISNQVQLQLTLNGLVVDRISGPNRFETCRAINQTYYLSPTTMVFANGYTVADALTAGPVAGRLGYPIQLIPKENLDSSLQDYIRSLQLTKTYLLGGDQVITPETMMVIYSLIR